jgi:glycosyltransferase involved in cell wall biosynthesis
MLRHYDQHGGGVKVYTRQLISALLDLPSEHEFVLLYNNPARVGTYGSHARVKEIAVRGESVPWWDQVGVPAAVRKYGIDVLYNPKYSIPLMVRCPTAWVCHGLDWYVMPEASRWIDRLSHRFLVPRYAAKARAIIAVSEITRQHVIQFLKVPPERVHTVYSGVEAAYGMALEKSRLDSIRAQYSLPFRYFLYAGAIYPPKNFTRMVRAYAKVGPARGIPLVIAGGENRFLSEQELLEPQRLGLEEWVKWVGWVDTEVLPAFYQMAVALLLPSLFESFGLPVLEAMASGCPVVTADRYGTREIAQGAAVLVDPESVDAIAAGMLAVLEDASLRAGLIAAGRNRARSFTWNRCASQTLAVLEGLM